MAGPNIQLQWLPDPVIDKKKLLQQYRYEHTFYACLLLLSDAINQEYNVDPTFLRLVSPLRYDLTLRRPSFCSCSPAPESL